MKFWTWQSVMCWSMIIPSFGSSRSWKLFGHCINFLSYFLCRVRYTYITYLEIYTKRLIWEHVSYMLNDTVNCINCQLLIFQYRDIAEEVYHILQKHRPLVKPMTFVGQSSTGKQSKGFTQKQQLKVSKLGVSELFANATSL